MNSIIESQIEYQYCYRFIAAKVNEDDKACYYIIRSDDPRLSPTFITEYKPTGKEFPLSFFLENMKK